MSCWYDVTVTGEVWAVRAFRDNKANNLPESGETDKYYRNSLREGWAADGSAPIVIYAVATSGVLCDA